MTHEENRLLFPIPLFRRERIVMDWCRATVEVGEDRKEKKKERVRGVEEISIGTKSRKISLGLSMQSRQSRQRR